MSGAHGEAERRAVAGVDRLEARGGLGALGQARQRQVDPVRGQGGGGVGRGDEDHLAPQRAADGAGEVALEPPVGVEPRLGDDRGRGQGGKPDPQRSRLGGGLGRRARPMRPRGRAAPRPRGGFCSIRARIWVACHAGPIAPAARRPNQEYRACQRRKICRGAGTAENPKRYPPVGAAGDDMSPASGRMGRIRLRVVRGETRRLFSNPPDTLTRRADRPYPGPQNPRSCGDIPMPFDLALRGRLASARSPSPPRCRPRAPRRRSRWSSSTCSCGPGRWWRSSRAS